MRTSVSWTRLGLLAITPIAFAVAAMTASAAGPSDTLSPALRQAGEPRLTPIQRRGA